MVEVLHYPSALLVLNDVVVVVVAQISFGVIKTYVTQLSI